LDERAPRLLLRGWHRRKNLDILGESLGIELELEAQEKDVGPFRADILCKNTAEKDSWVVIENQIERTDHKHLGQLLTYASGLRASTIVWISAEFCEEHRAALNWLNQMADKSARFFGLESNYGKLGFPTAPRFNVVCQPNDWETTVRHAAEILTDDRSDTFAKICELNTGRHFAPIYKRRRASYAHKSPPRPLV